MLVSMSMTSEDAVCGIHGGPCNAQALHCLLAAFLALGCGEKKLEHLDAGTDGAAPSSACPVGFEETGNVFYVDPAAGDDTSDGSLANPWASIQHVVENYVDCVDKDGVALHSDAPVKGGDTIVLVGADGHDPEIDISGCYNDDYVKIKADVLHEPRVQFVHFRGSAYWRIDGLGLFNDTAGTMVRIEDHDWQGDAHHIEIFNNHLTSGDLTTVQEFEDHASNGIWLLSPEYVTVKCNHLYKVQQAMTVSGEHLTIESNTIEFFSRDAFATGGHHNRFLGNLVYDSVKLGDGHHDDFFQSHMGANPDVSTYIEVAYNIFMNRYSDALPLDMQGSTQCLSAFEDGPKRGISIYNNVCKTDHYHGIRWADTNDSVIINNTVIGGAGLPGLPPGSEEWPDHSWISIDGENNTVRNNLCTLDQTDGDHNIEVADDEVDLYFVDFVNLDLRLLDSAPAVNAGSPDLAPSDDVLGNPRDSTPDVGAYEYAAP
jgi:hypothetical protein